MSKSVMREKSMPVMKWFSAAMLACTLLVGGGLHAAQIEREKVEVLPYSDFAEGASLAWEDVSIPTRPGVRQRLLIARAANAGRRAVILFKGGSGIPITYDEGEKLKFVDNFLVRSSPLFAQAGFVTAVVDAPSDRSGGMDDHFRSSKAHHADIRAAVDFLVSEGAREVFLVGTSRGTVSAAYLASVMTHPSVKGYVLTASVDSIVFDTEKIERPVLMVHHSDDECRVTTYTAAVASYRAITKSPRKGFITITGGDMSLSHPCRAMSAHGFIGAERETVAAIVDWMNGKTPPANVSP